MGESASLQTRYIINAVALKLQQSGEILRMPLEDGLGTYWLGDRVISLLFQLVPYVATYFSFRLVMR